MEKLLFKNNPVLSKCKFKMYIARKQTCFQGAEVTQAQYVANKTAGRLLVKYFK
jgi:GR25 family glycosyltransferase involved in LPS biosynthesis